MHTDFKQFLMTVERPMRTVQIMTFRFKLILSPFKRVACSELILTKYNNGSYSSFRLKTRFRGLNDQNLNDLDLTWAFLGVTVFIIIKTSFMC